MPHQKNQCTVMYCTLLKRKRMIIHGISNVPYARLVPKDMQHAKRDRKAPQSIDTIAGATWHPISSGIDIAHNWEQQRRETKEQLHR